MKISGKFPQTSELRIILKCSTEPRKSDRQTFGGPIDIKNLEKINAKRILTIEIFRMSNVVDVSSSLYRILRLGGSPEQWGGVLFSLEKSKISRFFKLENF